MRSSTLSVAVVALLSTSGFAHGADQLSELKQECQQGNRTACVRASNFAMSVAQCTGDPARGCPRADESLLRDLGAECKQLNVTACVRMDVLVGQRDRCRSLMADACTYALATSLGEK